MESRFTRWDRREGGDKGKEEAMEKQLFDHSRCDHLKCWFGEGCAERVKQTKRPTYEGLAKML